MKKLGKKRLFAWVSMLLLASFFAAPCCAAGVGGSPSSEGQPAAEPNTKKDTVTIKKQKKGYVCYVNGRQVKKQWITVQGKGTYYFKKNGYAAVQSTKIGKTYYVFKKNGKLIKPAKTKIVSVGNKKYLVDKTGKAIKGWYKINGKKYYFDKKTGAMYTGVRVIGMEKFYAFKSNGKLDNAKTKKIRKAAKYEKSISALKKILGKPIKKKYYNGCYGPGKDGAWTYKYVVVSTYRSPGGKEIYMGVDPR